jgi:hypothetical protein
VLKGACRVGVLMTGLTFSALAAIAQSDSATGAARELFNRYVDYEHAFDVAQCDLYAPDAVIKNVRIYPGGQQQVLSFKGAEYKRLLRAALPIAKAKNDFNQYSQVTYSREGSGVRIKCTRFSQLKQYSSPLEMYVAPVGSTWQILSETSQSKP